MTCRVCKKQLSAYADGELSSPRRAEIKAHVDDCAACKLVLEQQTSAMALLSAQPELEPSPSFDVDFERKLRLAQAEAEQSKQGKRARWRWPALATVAAGACAILLAVTVMRSTVRPPTASSPISDLHVARNLDLIENYQVVDNLDGLEDFDVITGLEGLLEEKTQ